MFVNCRFLCRSPRHNCRRFSHSHYYRRVLRCNSSCLVSLLSSSRRGGGGGCGSLLLQERQQQQQEPARSVLSCLMEYVRCVVVLSVWPGRVTDSASSLPLGLCLWSVSRQSLVPAPPPQHLPLLPSPPPSCCLRDLYLKYQGGWWWWRNIVRHTLYGC